MDALSATCAVAAANATCAIYINGFEYQEHSMSPSAFRNMPTDCRSHNSILRNAEKSARKSSVVVKPLIHTILSWQYTTNWQKTFAIKRTVSYLIPSRAAFVWTWGLRWFFKTLKFILDELSIPCFVVNGTATDPQTGITKVTLEYRKIDNSWVHIDLTFDATISQSPVLRHDYFGLTRQR